MSIREDSNAVFQQFGLNYDPFAPGSSSFQFYKPGRRQVLEQLIHFSRYSQLLLAVTGPRGSGKTVLRHAMAAAGKDNALNVVVSALKQGDAGSILQQLSYALQVSGGDVMLLLRAADQSALAGKDVQVLVDDAELLDDSALTLLQRLSEGDGQSRCRVFLFGEPALQNRLQALAQQPEGLEYHLIELEPWTDDEVEGYLQQRLQSAGSDLDLFTDHELGVLLDQGKGWPGIINQTAQELLLARLDRPAQRPAAPARSAARTGSPLPYRHLAALLAVAFIFIFAWYQIDDSSDKAEPARPALGAASPSAQPGVVNGGQRRVSLDLSAGSQDTAAVPPVTQGVATPRQEQLPPRPGVQPALRPTLDTPVVQAATPAAPAVNPAPVQVATPTAPAPVQAAAAPESIAVPVVPATPVEPARPAPAKPAEVARPKVADTVAARNQAQPQARAPQQPAAATAPAAAPANAAGWYAGQPAQQFTLQVFATANEQNARQFVQSNGGQYHYFRKQHNGQSLYVVTYGSFANAAAARSAIEQLPEAVKRNKPWPRTFASVRQDIR